MRLPSCASVGVGPAREALLRPAAAEILTAVSAEGRRRSLKNPVPHPMLAALRKLLGGIGSNESADNSTASALQSDVRLAACALLVELAKVDGEFSALEHQRILEILQRHFGLTVVDADALVAAAVVECRKSVDDFTFTRQVLRDYDLGQRMLLAELMWQVVLADGVIDDNESYLMRKLANLLQLDPAFLSEARRKTEESRK